MHPPSLVNDSPLCQRQRRVVSVTLTLKIEIDNAIDDEDACAKAEADVLGLRLTYGPRNVSVDSSTVIE